MRSVPRVELGSRAQAPLLIVAIGGSGAGSRGAVDALASTETSGLESGIRWHILLLLLVHLMFIADVGDAVLISPRIWLISAIDT